MEEIMQVLLRAGPNPDYAKTDYHGQVRIKRKWVEVKTYKEASQVCLQFIKENLLGGGNWWGGDIRMAPRKPVIAHVSYNGRVWEGKVGGDGKEISI